MPDQLQAALLVLNEPRVRSAIWVVIAEGRRLAENAEV
jgi:hypothetical protein